jgi:hypothetical protein
MHPIRMNATIFGHTWVKLVQFWTNVGLVESPNADQPNLFLRKHDGALEQAPVSLAVLTGLDFLDISNNDIESLPSLTQLTRLSTLRCAYNNMHSLPMGLHKLTTLTHLDANHNPPMSSPPQSIITQGLPHVMPWMMEEVMVYATRCP